MRFYRSGEYKMSPRRLSAALATFDPREIFSILMIISLMLSLFVGFEIDVQIRSDVH